MIDLDEIAQQLRSWGYGHVAEQVRQASMERDTLAAKLDKAERRASQFEGWWAGLKVSSEQQIRDISRKALDCADHGRIIAELEGQVAHYDQSYREADKVRGRYGAFLITLRQSLEALDPLRHSATQLRAELIRQIKSTLR